MDLLNALADSIHEDPGLSDAWLQEIGRRREQIASGEVEPLEEDENVREDRGPAEVRHVRYESAAEIQEAVDFYDARRKKLGTRSWRWFARRSGG